MTNAKKISLILLLSLIFCSGALRAQTPLVDSLLDRLKKTKEDTVKIKLMLDIAWEFTAFNPDSSILMASQAREMIQQWQNNQKNTKANLRFIDHARADAFNVTGVSYYIKSEFKKAIASYRVAVKIMERRKNFGRTGTFLNNIANAHQAMSEYNQAIRCYRRALELIRKSGDLVGEARALGNLGIVFYEQGNYPEALNYYFQAIKLNEKTKNTELLASNYDNMALIYKEQGNYDKALELFKKAIEIAKDRKDDVSIAVRYGNMGSVYQRLGQIKKAKEFYERAYEMSIKLGDKAGIARQLTNMGTVSEADNNFNQALDYFKQALAISQNIHDFDQISLCYGNIGFIYFKLERFSEAEQSIKKALSISYKANLWSVIVEQELGLSQLYDSLGRKELAYIHYRKFVDAGDTLANNEASRKQARMEMQYILDKTRETDSLKRAARVRSEAREQQNEIKDQQLYTLLGGIVFVLMCGVALISIRAFNQKKKANRNIALQKQLVEEKQKEILDSIHYAKRIQLALMPSEKQINKKVASMKRL